MRSLTRRHFHLLTLCALGLAVLLCRFAAAQTISSHHPSTDPPDAVAAAMPAPSPQKLKPGDQVMWQVTGQQGMSKTRVISDAGYVLVPLAGLVHVAGLSTREAAHAIESALKAGQYLLNPHVSLFLLKARVAVVGEVAKQGIYRMDPDATVLDLLADAGGTTPKSSGKIIIIRKGASGRLRTFQVDLQGLEHAGDGLSAAEMHLEGGDQVVVERAGTCYVNGQVNRPGIYSLQPGMTVLEAIAAAGGPTDKGSEGRVAIQRAAPGDRGYRTLSAKLTDRVHPGDVIVVKERIF
jgi:polysaccharide export outer membrane protein